MNENVEKQNRSARLCAILQSWLTYLRQKFLIALGVAAVTGASFLYTGGFSAQAYSDRLFIVGILITTIGIFVFVTIAGTRKNMGLPTIAKTQEDARKLMEQTNELRDKTEKRYDAGSQVWAIGVACLVLSVLLFFVLSMITI
jgi:sugar phosphate permease